MNTLPSSDYLLLLRGTQLEPGLAPEMKQRAMDAFTDWYERLTREGTLKAGQALAHEGTLVSGKANRTVIDGPFAEAKEAVGGYVLISVSNLAEATAVAETCPLIDYGAAVEVRPVKMRCSTIEQVAERLQRVR